MKHPFTSAESRWLKAVGRDPKAMTLSEGYLLLSMLIRTIEHTGSRSGLRKLMTKRDMCEGIIEKLKRPENE